MAKADLAQRLRYPHGVTGLRAGMCGGDLHRGRCTRRHRPRFGVLSGAWPSSGAVPSCGTTQSRGLRNMLRNVDIVDAHHHFINAPALVYPWIESRQPALTALLANYYDA